MRLIAKAIGMARARFYCSGRTTVQYIQDYASVIFWHTMYIQVLMNTEIGPGAP